ncbi:MAG: hypothetical protein HYY35_03525 [Deltaproteobacteria bacterium]|nr:hypothetical protein [Deltaproteobacteria bacterium]
MAFNSWAVVAIVIGVLVYIALPVALAVVYLSRVNAALGRDKPKKTVAGSAGTGGGPDA